MKPRVLSGMRPTGKLHLGHLLGALNNWTNLQSQYECLFMVADWHALMSEYADPSKISQYAIDNVIDWISCGVDPNRSALFIQSHVKEHLELNIILSCITPLGWLERSPTYKEQLREITTRDIKTYAFLGYPVLQAADILVYKANFVPVGEDQLPHLELAREIVRRFAHLYKPLFPEPEPILTQTPKLLGTDGRKMSKSYENFIALSDTPSDIKKKVMGMFTDPKRIKLSDPGHPKRCNIYSYFKIFKGESTQEIADHCLRAAMGCNDCKAKLTEALIETLVGIRAKRKELLKDKSLIIEMLKQGAQKASHIASRTMEEVKKTVGL